VRYEKKLLWVMSCEKVESRLIENCCKAGFFLNFKFKLEKLLNFQNFKFEKLPNVKILKFQISDLKNC
jgi:hypothetical protein